MKILNKGYKKNITNILALFFLIFPWITYLKVVEYNEAERGVFSSYQGVAVDFFLYYKERILIALAIIVICWFIGERIFPDKVDNNVPLLKGNNRWLFSLAVTSIVMAVISTIFSQHKATALWGSPTEGEGLWTLISYIIIILAFYNYFANEYGVKVIKSSISCLGIITVVLSMIEYFYKPLIQIGFVQKLISPSEYAELMSEIKTDAFGDAVSLTFYNPSYYGGFICIIVPFILIFYLSAEKLRDKLLNGILSVGLMFCVIVSNSTTAVYIAVAEYILLMVMYVIKCTGRKQAFISCAGLVGTLILITILYSVCSGNSIADLLTNANSATGQVVEKRFEVEDITLEEDSVVIRGEAATLRIIYSNSHIAFADENNNKVNATYEKGIFYFNDAAYEDITVEMIINSETDSEVMAKLVVDAGYDDTIDFYILENEKIYGIGQNNAIIEDIYDAGVPENLKQFYGAFTGRGYAWVNSLPILKKTIIMGVGPGNFAFNFKQQDYVGMLNTHGSTKYIIDKPHNAYLQYAINIGIPGMLAFFAIIGFTLLKGIRVYCKKVKGSRNIDTLHMAGVVAIVGFLIYSMINDSMITVTPVMCMVAGIVLATGYALTKGDSDGKK